MPALQRSLLCGCGASTLFARGRCRSCYRAWRLSRERFAGLREQALQRDRRACTLCGRAESLVVHHREPGRNALDRLLTLCRACHARIHSLARLRFTLSPWAKLLWREQHRHEIEQLELPFCAREKSRQLSAFRESGST